MLKKNFPRRKRLPHEIPGWVPDGEIFFITVNALPRGLNQLANDATALSILESLQHRTATCEWIVRLWLTMPDHIHALLIFCEGVGMKKSITNWKRFTANSMQVKWQEDFFDHRIRNIYEYDEKWSYIINNPMRAGLVASPEEWPYVWTQENLEL